MNENIVNRNAPLCRWPVKMKVLDELRLAVLSRKLSPVFNQIIDEEKITDELLPQLRNIYLPLADWVAQRHKDKPIVIGINGAQGSGKSTLSKILKALLQLGFAKSVLHLSIDDLYLSRQSRQQLAKEIHPLFRVRGVPGTHDVERGNQILSRLLKPDPELPLNIPVFDKASDDLLPEKAWRRIEKPVDIILFEGWCVGARAQDPADTGIAINDLERHDDAEGIWRDYVNRQLLAPYQSLFNYMDYLVMLKVPDMESVIEWRCLQEEKLAKHCLEEKSSSGCVMSPAEVSRFIMHYERITRANLAEMPARANVLLELNKQHQVDRVSVAS